MASKSILSSGLILAINVVCFSFAAWKSMECFIKYLEDPLVTKVGVEYTGHQNKFPTVTVSSRSLTSKRSNKWNTAHLNECGIK